MTECARFIWVGDPAPSLILKAPLRVVSQEPAIVVAHCRAAGVHQLAAPLIAPGLAQGVIRDPRAINIGKEKVGDGGKVGDGRAIGRVRRRQKGLHALVGQRKIPVGKGSDGLVAAGGAHGQAVAGAGRGAKGGVAGQQRAGGLAHARRRHGRAHVLGAGLVRAQRVAVPRGQAIVSKGHGVNGARAVLAAVQRGGPDVAGAAAVDKATDAAVRGRLQLCNAHARVGQPGHVALVGRAQLCNLLVHLGAVGALSRSHAVDDELETSGKRKGFDGLVPSGIDNGRLCITEQRKNCSSSSYGQYGAHDKRFGSRSRCHCAAPPALVLRRLLLSRFLFAGTGEPSERKGSDEGAVTEGPDRCR